MNRESFDKIVDKQCKNIKEILSVKGREYQRGDNVFHNFIIGSNKSGLTRRQVLRGFMLKHEVSVEDIWNDLMRKEQVSQELIEEKYNDIINYLIIEKAMCLEVNENIKKESPF